MLAHRLATLVVTIAVLAAVAAGMISWRLSEGPVDLPWLTNRLEDAANANGGPTKLSIGSVALAWEGFRRGVDRPLELRVTDVTVIDSNGGRRMTVPSAEVSLSLRDLLRGRVALRAVTVDRPRLNVIRAEDGTLSLDIGSLAEATDTEQSAQPAGATPIADVLAELARPIGEERAGEGSLFGLLRSVRVHDARVDVVDRQLGATWHAPQAEIDLMRQQKGGVEGTAELTLALGEQRASLTMSATMSAGAKEVRVRARLSPVTPSVLARAAPSLTDLAAFDAPVSADVGFDLDGRLALRNAQVSLRAGAGRAHIGKGNVAFQDASLVVSGTPQSLDVQGLRVTLRGQAFGQDTHLAARGTIQRGVDQVSAALTLDLDQVDFADLGSFWPEGTGGNARDWLVQNIPVGTARNGHVDIGLVASSDLSSVQLTRASGTLDGDGLQVYWLRPVPPIENGRAQLRIVDPDTLDIVVAAGRQRLRGQKPGALQIRDGRMRITGIMQAHQVSTIDANIAGPLPDAISLLREPRLALLDHTPIELKDPSGTTSVKLTLTVPLENNVRMDDIAVRAVAHLEDVHLGSVVAGRDVDQGVFDLDATGIGMKLTGRSLLAGIPATLDANMDFRAGPPNQVVQSVTVSGQPDSRQLAAAGLDAAPLLNGPTALRATLTEHRNGAGELAVGADLSGATLSLAQLEWRKPADVSAKLSVRLALDHDRLTRIDALQLDGEGIALRAQGTFASGRLDTVRIDRLVLGRTMVQGSVQLPQGRQEPYVVTLNGSALDLAPRLGRKSEPRTPGPKTEPTAGPPWMLDARFDRVLLANDGALSEVVVRAESDGRVLRQLRLNGATGARAPVNVQILPDKGGRRLTANIADAGVLFRGLDYVRTMQGGALSVEGRYDDTKPGQPLSGTVNLTDFRMHGAAALGRLLQAMTLYGLVEVMQGPGLGFSRLIMPFELTDDVLEMNDARAFSSSLGLTAKGRIDFAAQSIAMEGTIIPAYFFNSLLGNVPLVGKLFSPERGGGVFAASYTMRGALDDPSVSVNPLAALTPGFLRGLFGLF